MNGVKAEMFFNRLSKVFKHREKLASKQGISCYRLYDLDMPEYPLCIDKYGHYIHVSEYKRNHHLDELAYDAWMHSAVEVIAQVTGVENKNIFVKERKIIQSREEQYQKTDHSQDEVIVEENGIKFFVNLKDYVDTGLFLDHRITRKMVGDQSQGKKVLNLFAYTGSFSVYAALHGASEVETVDLSNTYIQWAKRNFALNGLNPEQYGFTTGDVLQILTQLPNPYYDIIICDPPTFSNSKKMKGILDTQRDHVWLINQCLSLLREEGQLYFSTNYSKFKLDRDKLHSENVKDITRQTTPFDFEGKLNRYCYLIKR